MKTLAIGYRFTYICKSACTKSHQHKFPKCPPRGDIPLHSCERLTQSVYGDIGCFLLMKASC